MVKTDNEILVVRSGCNPVKFASGGSRTTLSQFAESRHLNIANQDCKMNKKTLKPEDYLAPSGVLFITSRPVNA